MKLGVNIDHIAVLREAREVNDPDILQAMFVAIEAGADQITIHLREDRRHISDNDAFRIAKLSKVPVNLECSLNSEILEIVCTMQPYRATLVPEKRKEVTTEGGLDILGQSKKVANGIKKLKKHNIKTSLFIDPDLATIEMCAELGVDMVELHTGEYANIHAMLHGNLKDSNHSIKSLELPRDLLEKKLKEAEKRLKNGAKFAKKLGLEVAAGHGLNYQNVTPIANIKAIKELNIGQSIVARAVFTGLSDAIQTMNKLIQC